MRLLLILLLIAVALIQLQTATSATMSIPLTVTDVALSSPFYVGNKTVVSVTLQNHGNASISVIGVTLQVDWLPHNSTFTRTGNWEAIPYGGLLTLPIPVLVPSNTIPTQMRYRIIVLTNLGIWMDGWRTNIARDYYYDAYNSLRASIIGRLNNVHYVSPQAVQLGVEATDLLNQAEGSYATRGTRDGYILLLKANGLINQGDNAEVEYRQNQQNTNFNLYTLSILFIITLLAIGYLRSRSKKHRKI